MHIITKVFPHHYDQKALLLHSILGNLSWYRIKKKSRGKMNENDEYRKSVPELKVNLDLTN